MYGRLKIGTKILIMLSTVASAAVGVIGFFAYHSAGKSLEEESFNKLTAVREMKANQIEDYFKQIADQVHTFSEDRMIIDAMQAFKAGFESVGGGLPKTDTETAAIRLKVEAYYQREFLDRLRVNLERFRSARLKSALYLPTGDNAYLLQYLYIASNPHPTGAKHLLDDARDGSRYSRTHGVYHPIIRSYLERFGYYDIFLVDHVSGHIVYSVFKEVDFATSLAIGPYRNTNFAAAFKAAQKAGQRDFVQLVDFEPYAPSYNAPAAFIASPIYDGETKVGVLLFQMPIDRINAIMTSKEGWSAVGLGSSGETYIVGEDYKLRNQSRFLIEDSDNYFKMIEAMGLRPETIQRIRNLNSTIGLQPVRTVGTRAALNGETGSRIFPDYRGVSVLSSYKPLQIEGVKWAIMSEIDEAEAFRYVYSLRNFIMLLFSGLILLIVILALLFSKTITRPLKMLTRYSRDLSRHDFNDAVPMRFPEDLADFSGRRDEVGGLVQAFHRMQSELEQSIENLKTTTAAKERMEIELNIGREIQMSMLPLLFPAFPDHAEFTVYAALQPAREVGGDFYDFFFIDENRFCFCIGDVSGKGVPSALFMAVTKTLIKSRAADDISTASILTHVNNELSRDNASHMFATIFIGILDIRNGHTLYTNAGHNPPYIKPKGGPPKRLDKRHGPVIGVKPDLVYTEDPMLLAGGDTIYMYTDGITEARNPQKAFYTEKRLAAFLAADASKSVEDTVRASVASVKAFEAGAEQADDITVLIVQYLGMAPAAEIPPLELQILNRLPDIEEVQQRFDGFAREHRVPERVRRSIHVAVDELLNNIISYAFEDDDAHPIDLTIQLHQDRLSVTIADDGRAFNPFSAPSPDIEMLLAERKVGGLGIHVVRHVVDNRIYQRRHGRNIVTVEKYLAVDSR